jgi:glycosyltransferase involved in cell wall biosynthesis
MLRISIISNELPPYRIPFYQAVDQHPDVALQVLFCSKREPNRLWEIPALDFGHQFLRERVIAFKGRYIHSNPGVVPALRAFSPDVIVTGGFNPTHLYAFGYAMLRGIPHISMTDGTAHSERGLSRLHKLVRRAVYARSRAFIAASDGGQQLFNRYGISDRHCFRSCLCIDNTQFSPPAGAARTYDFLFCGRIEEVKNPLFALAAAVATAQALGRRVRILFVGAGAQEDELRAAALKRKALVQADFIGFTAHDALPAIYHAARIFLFPTLWDPWGVVANEACAAGLPVLVSPDAGVANELIVDGHNGHVCELDASLWGRRAAALLSQPDLWQRMSHNSLEAVKPYNYASAAAGLVAACRHARPGGRLVKARMPG